ncbi:MAG: zinc ABC transporter substrate-binding protein [marine benthic group bacterium]|nr:zinc ABC transporter substrate-binding protein [Gemmatimonadota bacterium]
MSKISASKSGRRCARVRVRFRRLAAAFSLAIPLACGPGPDHSISELPSIAVSIPPLAGIVDLLVPTDAATVEVLVPPGASPHAFEPGIGQLRLIERADLVIELGHPALAWERSWLDGLLAGTGTSRVQLADVCDVVEDDPHIWLDFECLRSMAWKTAATLAEFMPERSGEIESRRVAYAEAIDSLELRVSRELSESRVRSFLVQHPAWGYFARAHGLDQLSILSHGSDDRGSVALARVMEAARAEGIGTVIVQPQVNQEAARMVAGEIGAKVLVVDPLMRNPLESLGAMAEALRDDSGRD